MLLDLLCVRAREPRQRDPKKNTRTGLHLELKHRSFPNLAGLPGLSVEGFCNSLTKDSFPRVSDLLPL